MMEYNKVLKGKSFVLVSLLSKNISLTELCLTDHGAEVESTGCGIKTLRLLDKLHPKTPTLLIDVFELDVLRDFEVQEKLNRYKKMYFKKDSLSNRDKGEMEKLKKELYSIIDPNDPEISLLDIDKTKLYLEETLKELKEKNKNA